MSRTVKDASPLGSILGFCLFRYLQRACAKGPMSSDSVDCNQSEKTPKFSSTVLSEGIAVNCCVLFKLRKEGGG